MRLTENDIHDVAAYMADWWTERLQQGDREAFREYLRSAVAHQLATRPERPFLKLECDYDPREILLDAVRAAGVECTGMMFSARGILPQKHATDVFPARDADPEFDEPAQPARLIIKEGYGRRRDPIPLSEIIAGRRSLEERG